ncbi:MAG: hypothetical protein AAGI88_02915 [Pseudomonadota bacterium]
MSKPAQLSWIMLLCALLVAACGDSSDSGSSGQADPAEEGVFEEPVEDQRAIGFEIIEVLGPDTLRAWASSSISTEEFEALELPEGWIKNQPREGGEAVDGPDGGRFLRSPDATEDGEFLDEELFGYSWRHVATVVQSGRPMDEDDILTGRSVRKYHELTFNAGSNVILLISPDGLVYFRIGRDADRTSDDPTIPADWHLMDYTTPTDLVFNLSPRNTVIRTDNQDSFQGPVVIEELIASGDVPDPEQVGPLPLTPDICEDPVNMAIIQDSLAWRDGLDASALILEQVDRMVVEPTRGPFYMLNLIRYREFAEYADGRETDLTGREANALYSPVEFLAAIGAAPVYVAPVQEQLEGEDVIWEDVAIVRYPCPAGFFAMATDPEFRERLLNKDAGVESTIVMVTYLQPSMLPADMEFPEPAFPATAEDAGFDLVEVMDFREMAEYEAGSGEPERTGAEAFAQYEAAGSASAEIGIRTRATLDVQGVITGDTARSWDQAVILSVPSQAGYQAFLDDEARQQAEYHREAALENRYSMITSPFVTTISGNGGGNDDEEGDAQPPAAVPPITEAGVGTPCFSDDDCVGVGFCLSGGAGPGFCSRMCGAGECGEGFTCCSDCSEFAAAQLPFTGSACIVEAAVPQLSAPPISCTCQ